MTAPGLLAVAIGAVLGAWARWALALLLNASGRWLPYGTLAANLLGGLAIGAALAWFEARPPDPFWRLLLITGFLGALTTFSTFTAESLAMIQRGALGAAVLHSSAHLIGSLLAAALGHWVGRQLG